MAAKQPKIETEDGQLPQRGKGYDSVSGEGKLDSAHHLFLSTLWTKNHFYIFKWLGKHQKKNILWHMKII